MYGINQVFRMYVRLATGPGGLKSTRILAPVAVRFSGRYTYDEPRRKPDLSWRMRIKEIIKWRRLWETKEIVLSLKFLDPSIEIHMRYESLSG